MLPYSLLSLSYESLFLLLLFVLLSTYVRLEFGQMTDDEFLTMSLPERITDKPSAGKFYENPFQLRTFILPNVTFSLNFGCT